MLEHSNKPSRISQNLHTREFYFPFQPLEGIEESQVSAQVKGNEGGVDLGSNTQ